MPEKKAFAPEDVNIKNQGRLEKGDFEVLEKAAANVLNEIKKPTFGDKEAQALFADIKNEIIGKIDEETETLNVENIVEFKDTPQYDQLQHIGKLGQDLAEKATEMITSQEVSRENGAFTKKDIVNAETKLEEILKDKYNSDSLSHNIEYAAITEQESNNGISEEDSKMKTLLKEFKDLKIETIEQSRQKELKNIIDQVNSAYELKNKFMPYRVAIDKSFNEVTGIGSDDKKEQELMSKAVRLREITDDPFFVFDLNEESVQWVRDSLNIVDGMNQRAKISDSDRKEFRLSIQDTITKGVRANRANAPYGTGKFDKVNEVWDNIQLYRINHFDKQTAQKQELKGILRINKQELSKKKISEIEDIEDSIKKAEIEEVFDEIINENPAPPAREIRKEGHEAQEKTEENNKSSQQELDSLSSQLQEIEEQISNIQTGWFGFKKRLNKKKLDELNQERYKLLVEMTRTKVRSRSDQEKQKLRREFEESQKELSSQRANELKGYKESLGKETIERMEETIQARPERRKKRQEEEKRKVEAIQTDLDMEDFLYKTAPDQLEEFHKIKKIKEGTKKEKKIREQRKKQREEYTSEIDRASGGKTKQLRENRKEVRAKRKQDKEIDDILTNLEDAFKKQGITK